MALLPGTKRPCHQSPVTKKGGRPEAVFLRRPLPPPRPAEPCGLRRCGGP